MKTSTEIIRKMIQQSGNRIEMYRSFLGLLSTEIGAISGIAWDCSAQPFRPITQIQLDNNLPLKLAISESDHIKLLSRCLTGDSSILVRPKSDVDTGKHHVNPVLVISRIENSQTKDLLEIFLSNQLSDREYAERSSKLEQMCRELAHSTHELGTLNHGRSELAEIVPRPNTELLPGLESPKRISPAQLDEYVHQIHRSLDPIETARAVANETRRLLQCDRVSVVSIIGRRTKIRAVSGQPSVNNRSNTILQLRKLASAILPTRQTFWYPAEDNLPGEIETPLLEYLELAATRSMVVVPVFDKPPQLDERPNPVVQKERLIGGMIIEHCTEEWSRETVASAMDVVGRHGSDAIRNAYRHRQLLFYPVWKWLGKSKIVMAARHLPKTLAVAFAVIALGLALGLVPSNLKISCDGRVIPATRSNVFFPIEGTVRSIFVSHGESVKKGDLLVRLENTELDQKMLDVQGQIDASKDRIESIDTILDIDPENKANLDLERRVEAQRLVGLEGEKAFVKKRLEKLEIRSPRDGKVITWNLKDRFQNRPVAQGDHFLEVVDDQSPWELELELDDANAGHVLAAAKSKSKIEVEFILAADPDQKFDGTVSQIGKATYLTADQTQVVPVSVEINSGELKIQQAKSSVTANLVCGKTSLGYALFHGVYEFVQKQWFRLF
ncbi:MAG: HlyD family efflux transporter periplasmic adaptor subunit [Planctomycetota bacterium]